MLRNALESVGFTVYPYEWWHFDYKDWQRYPILNLTLEQSAHPIRQTGFLHDWAPSPFVEGFPTPPDFHTLFSGEL